MAWGDPEDFEMCRRCRTSYDEAENTGSSCHCHSGRVKDGVWDCCGGDLASSGCTTRSHVRSTPDEARAIRADRRARQAPRDLTKESPPKRCLMCGRAYREEDNSHAACGYHSGRLLDYDKVGQLGLGLAQDFWECCGAYVTDDEDPIGTGCTIGRHLESPPNAPGPIQRALDAHAELVRQGQAEISLKHPWTSPERLAMARRRIHRFLKGRVDFAGYEENEEEGLPCDVRLLEQGDFPYLLAEARAPTCPAERRHLLARFLNDAQKAAELRVAGG